jgi:hypothetical protein
MLCIQSKAADTHKQGLLVFMIGVRELFYLTSIIANKLVDEVTLHK